VTRPLVENPSRHTLYTRGWRERNRERDRTNQRRWKAERRRKVIDHYGGACACCGEDIFEFLAIDHIGGGGTQHRNALQMRGDQIIGWLVKNGLPDGFRVLCHNCNMALGFYGRCPHGEE
jgi:hypothetical protein